MMPDRVLDLEAQIQPRSDTRINRDFTPIAYYFDVALWSTRFNHAYRRAFQSIAGVRFGWLAAATGLVLLAIAGFARLRPAAERRLRTSAGFCVAAMGFTLIGLEVLLLLAFQAIYGYVYQELAIIIAGFMVGMALGSWRGLRRTAGSAGGSAGRGDLRRLAELQLLAAVSPLLLYVPFEFLAAIKSPLIASLASQILFPVLAVLCGFFGGFQFPIATRIFFAGSIGRAPSLGTLYALDLAGACLGAVVLTAYLIPVYGFLETAALMAVVNLAPAVLAWHLAHGREGLPA
jgi:spermidine synthase